MATRLFRMRRIHEQLINLNKSSEKFASEERFEKLLEKVEDAVQAYIYGVV